MRKRRGFCSCDRLSHQPVMGWFERLLLKLVPHFDIIKTIPCEVCDGTGADLTWTEPPPCDACLGTGKQTVLYLRRFYLWRSSWVGLNFGDLYLHKIYRSDDDPDPHDHPWSFRTFVLKGGYYDESWTFVDGQRHRLYLPGSAVSAPATRFRPRQHIHRVILKDDQPAWTLVWTTGYVRDSKGDADWCFVTERARVPWRIYLGLDGNEEHGG
jgi:hypothetical protein